MGKIYDKRPVAAQKQGFGKPRFRLREFHAALNRFAVEIKPCAAVKGFHKLNIRKGSPVLPLIGR